MPKSRDGAAEAIRALRVARAGAVKARTQAGNQLRDLILTAPEQVRRQLAGLPCQRQVDVAVRFRPQNLSNPAVGARAAMASVARRHRDLTTEIARLDAAFEELVTHAAPAGFLAKQGVATRVAAPCWPPSATTPAGSARRPASPRCAAPARSTPPLASNAVTGSTAAATGKPAPRCGRSP